MARKATNLDDARTYAAGITDANVQHAIEAIIRACEGFANEITELYQNVDDIQRKLSIRR